MALSLDTIKQWADNPDSIPAAGSYGEGRISQGLAALRQLKAEVAAGRMSINDYFSLAEPIGLSVGHFAQNLAGSGQTRGNAANAAGYQALINEGFIKNDGSGWTVKAPFTAREYANLPDNVLPTRDDVNSGRIPLDLLPPVQRFRTDTPSTPPTTPQVNPGTTGATTQVPDPANPGKFINVPVVGDPLQNSVPKVIDQSVIEQEGIRQAEQQRQAYEAQNALSSQRMQQLRDLLSQQEDQQFNLDKPGIYEDLNSKGLLRSSGLGQALAKEKATLAAQTNNQLSQQSLGDTDRQIQSIADILSGQQKFQTSGLERRFTLEDFNREQAAAKALGSQYAPSVKSGSSVLSGVLGGAGTGLAAGAATRNPYAAGAGAIIGAAGGGATAKGK